FGAAGQAERGDRLLRVRRTAALARLAAHAPAAEDRAPRALRRVPAGRQLEEGLEGVAAREGVRVEGSARDGLQVRAAHRMALTAEAQAAVAGAVRVVVPGTARCT